MTLSRIDSSLWVKICGLMVPEQAITIAHLGANAIGFISVRSSPRYVTPLQIRAISESLLAESLIQVERVGVFANPTEAELQEAVDVGQLTTLQLHGQETPTICHQISEAYPRLRLIKALRIRSDADLAIAKTYEDIVDAVLLDAYHPKLLGGTGKTLDWRSLHHFQLSKPWILAGGLTPQNIGEALDTVTPHGIDLSSGVEISPGNKSLDKVKILFKQLASRSKNSEYS
ncbi:phosphoribosylanthranilate isomerase [Oscillatoria sp. CS-180]|uniref:phosphoribosylanthranilate isomerase n=1 Tax=Oscillatoria sp. CS-180 TaxID=3021720 RepID=UPI002330F5B9|nr:phosphoribosylanthranilate isomerase [Oscillatoria sp. CS-180]MDB9529232.1 phosphoribosylanthranilate isomerase [Oscillatoria sp. CS-180]